jgi:hypothetical protein
MTYADIRPDRFSDYQVTDFLFRVFTGFCAKNELVGVSIAQFVDDRKSDFERL